MWGILICLTAPDHVILIFLKVAMNSVSQQEMQELELDVVNAKPLKLVVLQIIGKRLALFLITNLSKHNRKFKSSRCFMLHK